MIDPASLQPGYAHLRRGTAAYAGALRTDPHAKAEWTCPHSHTAPYTARLCAEGELERRKQAGRAVLTLLNCKVCERWWSDSAATVCPRCSVPLDRVKAAVLERGPASLTQDHH
jgi:hypothetical protein